MRALLPLIAMTAACSGSDKAGVTSGDTGSLSREPCLEEPMTLTVGTGEFAFKPLTPGGRIEVIHGTQDGHHILGSLRIQNITDIATIHYTITTVATGDRISDQVYRLRLADHPEMGDCSKQAIGMYGYLGRIDPADAPFLSNANLLEMTATNTAGESSTVSIEVYPFVDAVEHGSDTAEPTAE